ncbi:MAG: glycosyltransferase [Bacteroidota bacterium]
MKLVKVANYYNSFLKYYYQKHPEINKKSFSEQYEHLMYQSIGWSDFYSKALKKHDIDSYEIVYNALSLQQTWAKENNTNAKDLDILTQQIKFHQPDIIWFQDSFSFDAEYIKFLKKEIRSVKLLIGNSCAPYTKSNLKNLKVFDFVTTCSPVFVNDFEKNGIKPLLLYHAFAPEILSRIGEQSKEMDIVFAGSLIPRKGFHFERKKFLEKIATNENIDFSFYGNLFNHRYADVIKQQVLYGLKEIIQKTGTSKFFSKSVKYKKVENLDEFPQYLRISKSLQKKYNGQLYGIDMYRKLAKAKLTFDVQGEIGGDYVATMRVFEATGIGLCLLLENKKNVQDLFEIDKEIVTFNSFDEAIEKINWLLNNKHKLSEIGEAAQARVLKDHTYDNRAEKLYDYIRNFI